MTIEIKPIMFYTCSKCQHEWTNWNGKNKTEGLTPRSCPSCRNVRWNQYCSRERNLIKILEAEHLIRNVRNDFYSGNIDEIDFIVYDFLYEIQPLPELFELQQGPGNIR